MKENLILVPMLALVLAALACDGGSTTPSAPESGGSSSGTSGEEEGFSDGQYSEKLIDGTSGGSLEPVMCGNGEGQVAVGPGAYEGAETITMECLSSNKLQDIKESFESDPARTAGAKTVLGAIELGPDGLPYGDRLFGGEGVTVTVPLVAKYTGAAADIVSLFVYLSASNSFEEVSEASIQTSLWAACGDVPHFTTIVVVGPAPGGATVLSPAPPPVAGLTGSDSCDDVSFECFNRVAWSTVSEAAYYNVYYQFCVGEVYNDGIEEGLTATQFSFSDDLGCLGTRTIEVEACSPDNVCSERVSTEF